MAGGSDSWTFSTLGVEKGGHTTWSAMPGSMAGLFVAACSVACPKLGFWLECQKFLPAANNRRGLQLGVSVAASHTNLANPVFFFPPRKNYTLNFQNISVSAAKRTPQVSCARVFLGMATSIAPTSWRRLGRMSGSGVLYVT